MTTDKKKGPSAPTLDPRKHKATDPISVRQQPRRHEGPEAQRLRRMCGDLHPIDAANTYAATFDPSDRAGMLFALRDLAVALRREAGQPRRDAQVEVDAVLATWEPDDDLLATIAAFAVRLAACWTPEPLPPLRLLGVQLLEVELVGA